MCTEAIATVGRLFERHKPPAVSGVRRAPQPLGQSPHFSIVSAPFG